MMWTRQALECIKMIPFTMDKLHVTTNTPLLFQLGQLRRGLYSLRG